MVAYYGKISMFAFIFKRKCEKYSTLAKMAALCLHLELWGRFDSPRWYMYMKVHSWPWPSTFIYIKLHYDIDLQPVLYNLCIWVELRPLSARLTLHIKIVKRVLGVQKRLILVNNCSKVALKNAQGTLHLEHKQGIIMVMATRVLLY